MYAEFLRYLLYSSYLFFPHNVEMKGQKPGNQSCLHMDMTLSKKRHFVKNYYLSVNAGVNRSTRPLDEYSSRF